MIQKVNGNWTDLRRQFGLQPDDEIDLHFGPRVRGGLGPPKSYDEAMSEVADFVKQVLRAAQQKGRPYIMFVHGYSTSRPGKTTARSVVRQFMRSKEATPFIDRKRSVQHETVFVAKIKGVPD